MWSDAVPAVSPRSRGAGVQVGDVAVWWRHTNLLPAADVERMTRMLSADERRRQRRFVFEHDRRDFTAAHALLREALSACVGRDPKSWCFEPDASGKPHIHPKEEGAGALTFSLSHTRGLVACAVAHGADVGLDVERVDRVAAPQAIASRHFAQSEIRLLDSCAPGEHAMRFIELWTLKEAYVKATGAGLTMPLDSFAFGFDGRNGLGFTAPSGGAGWEFLLAAPSSDTRLALAIRSTAMDTAWRVTAACADSGPQCVPALRWSAMMDCGQLPVLLGAVCDPASSGDFEQ
jgi:4'-phosphopantetheinyl transferase